MENTQWKTLGRMVFIAALFAWAGFAQLANVVDLAQTTVVHAQK